MSHKADSFSGRRREPLQNELKLVKIVEVIWKYTEFIVFGENNI